MAKAPTPTKAGKISKPDPKPQPKANKAHEAVKGLDKLFRTSPPPGSESGNYAPSKNDGFSEPPYPHPVPDGAFRVKGSAWTFSFQGGRMIQAVRSEVKALIPGKITEI